MPLVPTAPTDNLYKFISIFGLALVISSIVLAYEADRELRDGLQVQQREIHAATSHDQLRVVEDLISDSAGYAFLADDSTNLGKFARRAGLVESHKRISAFSAQQHRMSIRAANGSDSLNWKVLQQMVLKNDSIDEEIALIGQRSREEAYLLWWLRALGLIGTLVSVTGFTLWFFRVQRYEDSRLRHDALRTDPPLGNDKAVKRVVSRKRSGRSSTED